MMKLRHIPSDEPLPPDAEQIHLIPFTAALTPRGSMNKNSLGRTIYDKMISSFEYFTDPKYADNPTPDVLADNLVETARSECEEAIALFLRNTKGKR